MKLNNIMALITALLIAPFAAFARAFTPQGLDALNIQGTHDGPLSRTAEGAIASPHLMLTWGTAPATQVKLCTAALPPIGTAYDPAADTDPVTVRRLMDGITKIGIGSKAIAAGVRVYCTAGGKLTDAVVVGAYLAGISLTACTGDGAEFEFEPYSPVINPA